MPRTVKPKGTRIASQKSRVIKQTHVMTIKSVQINIYDIDFAVTLLSLMLCNSFGTNVGQNIGVLMFYSDSVV